MYPPNICNIYQEARSNIQSSLTKLETSTLSDDEKGQISSDLNDKIHFYEVMSLKPSNCATPETHYCKITAGSCYPLPLQFTCKMGASGLTYKTTDLIVGITADGLLQASSNQTVTKL